MSDKEAAAPAGRPDQSYYDKERDFLDAEWKAVAAFRGYPKEEHESRRRELVGLALSGGGIRSASFALGVLQSLAKQDFLQRVDYLSTVSGGGYIGSALTWFLHRNGRIGTRNPEPPPPRLDGKNFPLGEIHKSRREDISESLRAAILNYIRQHGDYLIPGGCLNLVSLVTVVLRSVLSSFFVYFSLLVLLLQALGALGAVLFPSHLGLELLLFFGDFSVKIGEADPRPLFVDLKPMERFDLTWLLALAAGLVAALLFTFLLYSLATIVRLSVFERYRLRIHAQCFMGWLATLALFAASLGSLPFVAHALTLYGSGSLTAGVVSMLLGAFGTYGSHLKAGKGDRLGSILGSNWYIAVIAALLLYGLLLLGYSVAVALVPDGATVIAEGIWAWNRSFLLLAAAGLTGICVNLNYASLHRMYRDRLMETFLPDPKDVAENTWHPAIEANRAGLWDFATPGTAGPYHLINSNVVLVDSEQAKYSGRGGDSFILSPYFCGSHATGWRWTAEYMRQGLFRGITLPTAMAISGAAVNPNTGVAGQGITRNRLVSFLMSLLNLRLGYWTLNPKRPAGREYRIPNFIDPGLKALRGKGFDEHRRLLELTDGGHFDNVGLYELIRRRTKLIVVSDGTADNKFTFSDFGNVVERVRVDFGVTVRFRNDAYDLRHILPQSAEIVETDPAAKAFAKKFPLAQRGFAVGQIEYPDADGKKKVYGVIVYIKSTLTKGLPADIYGYKSQNPTFPDQSTADQFFDEIQLEAYRELGYRLSKAVPWNEIRYRPQQFVVTEPNL